MGSSSVSAHRGLVQWQWLLLVVSLLNFWSLPTTAHVRIESIDALEGMNAVLRVRNSPINAVLFLWYRGKIVDIYNNIAYLSIKEGNYRRGIPCARLIVRDDGSLVVMSATVEDTGFYTLLVQLQGCEQMVVCGELTVYPRVRVPTLIASSTTVTENKDAVVMSCNTNHGDIEWFFNKESLQQAERMKLSLDRRNLTIDPVLRWDAGTYQCRASNPKSSRKSPALNLNVKFE